LLIVPESGREAAPDVAFLTCFEDEDKEEEEEEEDDGEEDCARAGRAGPTSKIARQLQEQPQKTQRKLIQPCYPRKPS
jgi:hypothetical protein